MFNLLNIIGVGHLLGGLESFVDGAISKVYDILFGQVLWPISQLFFIILDMFDTLFRQFAGLNTVSGIDGAYTGDLVLYFINSSLVQEIFFSIMVLSFFLLVIFTIMAIVKNIYTDKPKPVKDIINGSVKALLMYLLVPVATIVCLIVGNIVLAAVDSATNSTGQTSSELLFVTAAYNANVLRDDDLSTSQGNLAWLMDTNALYLIEDDLASLGVSSRADAYNVDASTMEKIAVLIDDNFCNGGLTAVSGVWNYNIVTQYYLGMEISQPIIWIGGAFLIGFIGKITWGVIGRIFKMTLYFAISPAVIATFPIDNGKALGSWRGEMVKQGSSVIVAIGVVNVLYSILPSFNSLKVFGGVGDPVSEGIALLFMNIVAFASGKDLISAITGWFGTGNAYADGVATKKAVTEPLKKAAKTGIGLYAGARGGWESAKDHGKNKWMGALTGALSTTPLGKNEFLAEKEKQEKAGKEGVKHRYTSRWGGLGGEDKDKVARWEAQEAVDKENKAIDAKLAQMKIVRDNQLRELIAKGIGPDDAEYKDLEKSWEKAMDKVKASASYLEALFDVQKMDLESKQKKAEKRQSMFGGSFDKYEQAVEQDAIYKGQIEAMMKSSGILGRTESLTDDMYAKMKKGQFSSIMAGGAHAEDIKNIYSTYATEIANTAHEIQRAEQTIVNLANSGEKGLKYVQQVLGDQIGNIMKSTIIDGVATYSLKDDYDSSALSSKIKDEQAAVNKIVADLEAAEDQLFKDRLDKIGNLSADDLLKIGKSQQK